MLAKKILLNSFHITKHTYTTNNIIPLSLTHFIFQQHLTRLSLFGLSMECSLERTTFTLAITAIKKKHRLSGILIVRAVVSHLLHEATIQILFCDWRA